MKDNLVGELKIMKDLNIIPNCSALQRKYGTDRHTIKKYYANDGIPLRKKVERTSRWDPLYDEIVCLMEIDSVSKKAVYNYLENKYKDNIPGTYNGFKAYINVNIIMYKNDHLRCTTVFPFNMIRNIVL